LALGLAVARTFRGIPNTLLSMRTFWSQSVLCAVCAKLLASEAQGSRADTAFVGGLLHDIGKLVLAIRAPEETRAALTASRKDPVNQPMYRCERELFGFDHADIGGELMRRWQLPANLIAAVEFHHEPERANKFAREAALVHIANVLTHLAERDSLDPSVAPPIHPFAWRATGLAPEVITQVVPAARAAVAEVKMLLNLDSSR
jgi:putative nucleotidyltransferase with HDIG domain